MRLSLILLSLCVFAAASSISQAEVYKWKDKDGTIKYSDTPPPSNIKQETMGRKKVATPTNTAPLAPAESANAAPVKIKDKPESIEAAESPEAAAARQRQQNAESEKRNKQEKESEAKRKAENCNAAKANMQSYTQGGRVYKMNAKGEREYLDEKGFTEGRQNAQREINENC